MCHRFETCTAYIPPFLRLISPNIQTIPEMQPPFEHLIRKKEGLKMKPKTPSFNSLIKYHGICLFTEGRSQRAIEWYASNLRRFLQFLRKREMPDEIVDIGVTEARSFIFYLRNEATRWEGSLYTRDEKRLVPLFRCKAMYER